MLYEVITVSGGLNVEMVGKTYTLLVRQTDRKAGYLSGQTEGKITVRFASENNELIGQFVKVKITSSSNFSIEGELVKEEVSVEA